MRALFVIMVNVIIEKVVMSLFMCLFSSASVWVCLSIHSSKILDLDILIYIKFLSHFIIVCN